MSGITGRSKRKTAGRRMTALVGKAQEEDDTFWGHDTWAEDGDSGNESFRDSDEDSALKKDEFDSDFNDSESDHEDEERAAGEEEERELKRQERSTARGKKYMDVATTTTKRVPRGKGKRVVGDGMNAGIVLNFPGGSAPLPTPVVTPLQPPPATTTAAPKQAKKPTKRITMASTRERRSGTIHKRLRESTTKASATQAPARKTAKTGSRKAGKRLWTQEELLIEAVHETEPANQRWLLARKRIKDIEDQDKEAMANKDKNKGKLIQKFHSKRGCLKTLTFPDMDSVPEILTRSKVVLKEPKKSFCVITGKRARYKDPKTNLGYFDLAAFTELRRRLAANEPLDQRKKAETKAPPSDKAPTTSNATPTAPANAKTQPKSKTMTIPKPGAIPTTNHTPNGPDAAQTLTTPKADPSTQVATTVNAANGPSFPQLSPSGRRISPRSWKPSEKMRETIVTNPQMGKLVKLNLASPEKVSLDIPDATTSNTSKSNGISSKPNLALAPKPEPATAPKIGTGEATTTVTASSTSAPAPQHDNNSNGSNTSTVAKDKSMVLPPKLAQKSMSTKEPAKAESTTTTTTAPTMGGPPKGPSQPSHKPLPGRDILYTNPAQSPTAGNSKEYISQSQLIMQVIHDYNKQHSGTK